MTMHEEVTDKLSEYLDGELEAGEREAVETHLRDCPACAGVLAELRQVVARAQSLTPRPPERELWSAVAERLDAGPNRSWRRLAADSRTTAPRRFSFTLSQLAAAAVVLVGVSSAVVWQLADRSVRAIPTPAPAERAADAGARPPDARTDAAAAATQAEAAEHVTAAVGLADAQYDAAVVDLDKALKRGRGRLDAQTITIVEHNLQIIDQAIAQAREALAADPANTYLSGHLVEARRRKLDLLRRATALADTN